MVSEEGEERKETATVRQQIGQPVDDDDAVPEDGWNPSKSTAPVAHFRMP